MSDAERVRNLLLVLLVAAVAFVTAFFPVRASDDDWWHIKTGLYLLSSDEWFPDSDVFSVTGSVRDWVNHEWLSDLLWGLLFRTVSLYGMVWIKALFLAGVYMLLYRHLVDRCGHRVIAALCAIMAVVCGQFTMYLRPPILTYGFLVGTLMLLERARMTLQPRWMVALCALMVPWINLHGGAIIGLVALAAYAAGAFTSLLVDPGRDRRRVMLYWVLGGVALGLASLCNPWGYRVHLLTYEVMKDPLLRHFIYELAPPEWAHAWLHPVMIVLLLSALVYALLQYLGMVPAGERQIHGGEALLALFFMQQSWQHVRHLPLFGIAAAAPIAVGLCTFFERLHTVEWRPRSFPELFFRGLVLLLGGYAFLAGLLFRAIPCLDHRGLVADAFPIEACRLIKAAGLPGPIFHPINCAGYLIYALSPETMKVYTDSRFDIHGSKPLVEVQFVFDIRNDYTFADIYSEPGYHWVLDALEPKGVPKDTVIWRHILDKHRINLVLAYADSPGMRRLDANPREWQRVYYRAGGPMLPTLRPWAKSLARALWGVANVWPIPGYALYVRRTPENAEALQRAARIMLQWRAQNLGNTP